MLAYALPWHDMPPATWRAPVVVLEAAVVFVIAVTPENVLLPLIVMAPSERTKLEFNPVS